MITDFENLLRLICVGGSFLMFFIAAIVGAKYKEDAWAFLFLLIGAAMFITGVQGVL